MTLSDTIRPAAEEATRHGAAVALPGPGGHGAALILGPSGAGKSTLALALIALGATLVADDRVGLRRVGPRVLASAPAALRGWIEARGAGFLRLPCLPHAPVSLIVDLGEEEAERLPPRRDADLLGVRVGRILRPQGRAAAELAPAVAALLRSGGGGPGPGPDSPASA